MPKLYISAPWDMKSYAKAAADRFKEEGWTIVSGWIYSDEGGDGATPEKLTEEALRDMYDVYRSDLLVLLNLQPRGLETSGKAVEMGMALAWNTPVIVVGNWSNVFHFLPEIKMVESVGEAVIEARKILVRRPAWGQ